MRQKNEMWPNQDKLATEFYERDASIGVVPMGGGKTTGSLTAIKELIDDHVIRCALVLAPKKVTALVWPYEHLEWDHLCGMDVQIVTGGPKQREKKLLELGHDVYVVGIDNTQWLMETLKQLSHDHPLYDFLLLDEISRFKNPRGKRAKLLAKHAREWQIRHGMTGTPRPQKKQLDLFMPLRIITANKLWGHSFDEWRRQNFMAMDYNGYDWQIFPHRKAAVEAEAAQYMFTVPDKVDKPEYHPVFHWVDLPPKARTMYEDMFEKLVAKHYDKENDRWIDAANKAVAVGKLTQLAQGFMYDDEKKYVADAHREKLDYYADTFGDIEENAVVCYWFSEDLKRLQDFHKGKFPYLGSGVSDVKAQNIMRRWNEGDIPKLGLHPASAGHGVNLQFGGHQMIWYGLTFSAELYDQTSQRLARPGQPYKVYGHHIMARNTYDEIAYQRVKNNIDEQEAFRLYLRKAGL